MRLLLPVCVMMVLLIACSTKDKVPGNVLPPAKMQAVLWDMMRADQFLSDYVLNRDTSTNKEKESIKLYSRIFTFHNISREEFKISFNYYRSHPKALQPLMDSMSKQSLAAPTLPVLADTVKLADTLPQQVQPTVPQPSSPQPVKDTTGQFFRKSKKPFVPVSGN